MTPDYRTLKSPINCMWFKTGQGFYHPFFGRKYQERLENYHFSDLRYPFSFCSLHLKLCLLLCLSSNDEIDISDVNQWKLIKNIF